MADEILPRAQKPQVGRTVLALVDSLIFIITSVGRKVLKMKTRIGGLVEFSVVRWPFVDNGSFSIS